MIYFLISLFTIDNISVSVQKSNFTLVFSKTAWNLNSGEIGKQAVSILHTLRLLFQNVSNT